MAIIQTIRNKYAKLAGFVVILALLGFVLMDLGKSGFKSSTTASEIDGTEIDIIELNSKTNMQRNLIALQTGQDVNDESTEQISEQMYENMVADILLDDIFSDLGITVSEEEIKDMFAGVSPDYSVQQIYSKLKPNQAYDPATAEEIMNALKNSSNANERQFWMSVEQHLMYTRRQAKVNTLIAASFYTPQVILDAQYELNNKVAQIDFIQLPYTFVSDDRVTVTDEEINNYINEHKYIFTNKMNSRDVEIVTIPIVPSTKDSMVFFAEMDSLKTLFTNSTNVDEFVSLNSAQPFVARYFSEKDLSSLANAKDITDAPINSIVGPFPFESNYFALAKVLDKTTVSDTVEVKELVVLAQMGNGQNLRSKEEAKARIDSAIAEINAGANFDSVALKYSDNGAQNPESINNKYYSAQYGGMPENMRNAIFQNAPNTSKLIEIDESGTILYSYIKIINKSSSTSPMTKVLFFTKDFLPSQETRNELEIKANTFTSNVAQGTKTFEQQAMEMGLVKRPVNGINTNSKLLPGVGVSVDFIKWAHNASIGSISPVTIINNSYVIGKLTSINTAGELNKSDAAINYAREEVKKKKKAEILKAEYDSKGNLTNISTASSQPITSIDTFMLSNPNNALLASETKVMGVALSSTGNGQTSTGIAGNSGVFYVSVRNVTGITPSAPRNVFVERKSQSNMYRQGAYRMLLNKRMENTKIKDNRNKFLN